LEDALLGETVDEESLVVLAVAVGGTRGDISTVGVGGAGDSCEPAVEEDVVLSHGSEDSDLVLGVVVDNLSSAGLVQSIKGDGLLSNETTHSLQVEEVGGILLGVVGAED
jgi:hypothetical protein